MFTLVISTAVWSQPQQQYLFSHLGTRNGLASNEIMAVEQDAEGFIWIATSNGLQRYDGRRLLSFNHIPGDVNSLPEGGVFALQIDKKNRLWLSCTGNRVGYFNTSTLKFHEVPVRYDDMSRRVAESRFLKDNEGNIILVLVKMAALTYNEEAGEFNSRFNPFQVPDTWNPLDFIQDRFSNSYWIGCDSGLVRYDPATRTMSYRGHNASKDPVINAVSYATNVLMPFRDMSGRFWMLSWPPKSAAQLLSFDPATKELKDWDPQISEMLKSKYHEIYTFRQQKDSTLWLYGHNLFAKFNPQKRRFELIQDNLPGEFSIRYDRVRNVFEDREYNLWLSTNKGLYRFNPAGQFFYSVPSRRLGRDTIFTSDVADILELQNGDILAGTWGNGIFPYDKDFNSVRRDYIDQSMKMGEGLVWCMIQRPNGEIWRGHQAAQIYITYPGNKKTVRITPKELGGSTVRQMVEDKNGDIWIGTHSGRLVKWHAATNHFSVVREFGSIIFRLYTDLRGDIWVCTRSHGISRLRSTDGNIITQYTADGPTGRKLGAVAAMDVIQYNDSIYLIAAASLNILNIKANTIRYFSTIQGMPSNTVNNIVKDRFGTVWITLESGICSFDMEREVMSSYNQNDGLPTINFNSGSATVLRDGRIAIGTTHELVVFDPAHILKIDQTPPDVSIVGFAVGNQWLQLDSLLGQPKIHLKATENSITVVFATLTFQNGYAISYMMEGIDKDWVRRASAQNQAVYNYLPPGRNYTFKVRAENGDVIYSKNIKQLKIHVHPPFWRTWWFFCLLALLIAAIVYWLDKQRVNKLVALQNVRSEIAGNLHEEVNTTLNNINLLSEMARIKADKEIDRSKEFIDQISNKSQSMIIAMDDILWSIDPQNDNMEKSLLRMMEFADALKNRHSATIELAIDKRVRSLRLNMKTRHEAFLIFKQALRVIVQYSGGKQTLINIDLFKNKLSIKLQDPIATLDKNITEIDNSIREMNDRATAINADLDMQYDKKGVAIILLVPVK